MSVAVGVPNVGRHRCAWLSPLFAYVFIFQKASSWSVRSSWRASALHSVQTRMTTTFFGQRNDDDEEEEETKNKDATTT